MGWLLGVSLIALVLACSEEPSEADIRKALSERYRWFGEVRDVRVISLVKLREEAYFAQIKFGIRFNRDLEEMERELLKKISGGGMHSGMGVLIGVVTLRELIQRCGRSTIVKGRTCYLSTNAELVNIRGSWTLRFR